VDTLKSYNHVDSRVQHVFIYIRKTNQQILTNIIERMINMLFNSNEYDVVMAAHVTNFLTVISLLMIVSYSMFTIKEHKKNRGIVAIGIIIGCIAFPFIYPHIDASINPLISGGTRTFTATSDTVLLAAMPLVVMTSISLLLRRKNRI